MASVVNNPNRLESLTQCDARARVHTPCVRPWPEEYHSPKACHDVDALPTLRTGVRGIALPAPLDAQAMLQVHKQNPRNSRRHLLPMKRIHRSLLMGHAHVSRALVALLQLRQTPSGAAHVLPHPPEAFAGLAVMATMGREAMEAQLALVVVEGRVELVRPMDAAAIADHHNRCGDCAAGGHHLLHILAQLLGSNVRHHVREALGGAILDRPNDTAQHAARATAPRAILQPHLAFEGGSAFALPLAQGAAPPYASS